jgi:hypothetical protein
MKMIRYICGYFTWYVTVSLIVSGSVDYRIYIIDLAMAGISAVAAITLTKQKKEREEPKLFEFEK